MAFASLAITRNWITDTIVKEGNWDNVRTPLVAWSTYVKNNSRQIGKDCFGPSYTYNNDGVQTETPCLADRVATLEALTEVVSLSGQAETLDVNNYTNIMWKNPVVNPTVMLTLVGGKFDPAQYTEITEHGHTISNQDTDHRHTSEMSEQDTAHTHLKGAGTFRTFNTVSADHTHPLGASIVGHTHNLWMYSPQNADHVEFSDGGGAGGYANASDADASSGGPHQVVQNTKETGSTNAQNQAHYHDIEYVSLLNQSDDHKHTITGVQMSVQSASHKHTNSDTGTTTATSITAAEKTYADTLTVFIDAVDKTAELLVLAEANFTGEFTAFGDETAGHHLNDWTLTAPGPGTGEMDISSLVTTAAFHRIEIRQSGVAGAKINWYLTVSYAV